MAQPTHYYVQFGRASAHDATCKASSTGIARSATSRYVQITAKNVQTPLIIWAHILVQMHNGPNGKTLVASNSLQISLRVRDGSRELTLLSKAFVSLRPCAKSFECNIVGLPICTLLIRQGLTLLCTREHASTRLFRQTHTHTHTKVTRAAILISAKRDHISASMNACACYEFS